MKITLETLLGETTKEEFLKHYSENRPLHTAKMGAFLKLPFLESLENLLEFWPVGIEAMDPVVADEAKTLELAPEGAAELFKDGRALLFNDANLYSAELQQCLSGLQLELGLSALTYGRNLLYATPKGGGNAPHFDQNINFVLQLSGKKSWWVAPNTHVENPLTRHLIGSEMDPELQSYCPEMPETFPAGGEEFLLQPGSMLFVPRGAWHKTLAHSDSLSLNFTYSAPSWLDLLSAALRGRLAQSPKWRGTADFVSDPLRAPQAIENLDLLLAELAVDVQSWRAESLLGATEHS
ncbi:MAG: hypothetical protein HN509_09820 [Halobacteriovoraceae bacterium]|jgi:50S ribosomal protein L16 3-hydroxylase|nr:hypothetical protein [Halobacteriovoraceae bacterium]